MPFSIVVHNDGEDGTIQVIERINLNEQRVVFDDFIEHDGQRQVPCLGDPTKEFTWIHRATNLSGGPDTLGDGDTLRVDS